MYITPDGMPPSEVVEPVMVLVRLAVEEDMLLMSDFVALKMLLRKPFLCAISSPRILICRSAQGTSDLVMNSL